MAQLVSYSMAPKRLNYLGNSVSSGISFVFLSKGESDLDGLEGGVGGDGVAVAIDLHGDVRLGVGNHISLDQANSCNASASVRAPSLFPKCHFP